MSKEIAVAFFFESESTPGKHYQTLQYTDATTSCNCPGWTFKKKVDAKGNRTCRHTRDVDAGFARRSAAKFVEYRPVEASAAPTMTPRNPRLVFAPVRTGRVVDLEEETV